MTAPVRFLRVNGIRSHQPAVVAILDGILVKWNRHGWTCGCDDWALGDDCQHVDAVAALLDDRVLGDAG